MTLRAGIAQLVKRIATAGRSGIQFRWDEFFLTVQAGPEVHPASCTMGTGGKKGRGLALPTHQISIEIN